MSSGLKKIGNSALEWIAPKAGGSRKLNKKHAADLTVALVAIAGIAALAAVQLTGTFDWASRVKDFWNMRALPALQTTVTVGSNTYKVWEFVAVGAGSVALLGAVAGGCYRFGKSRGAKNPTPQNPPQDPKGPQVQNPPAGEEQNTPAGEEQNTLASEMRGQS